jgi:hypothetical protein
MITFTISDKEEERIKKWKDKHKKVCRLRSVGMSCLYSYEFTPNGIGSSIDVKCSCGERFNATDVDSW